MPVLKINQLTNLQDARYCAAMGIDYVGFCMERGHHRKLAEETLTEMREWLSGPRTVLDFGQDAEGLHDWHTRFPDTDDLLELYLPDADAPQMQLSPMPEVPPSRLYYTLPLLPEGGFGNEAILALAQQCHALELRPASFAQPVLQRLHSLLAQGINLLVNLDPTGPELLERLPQKPFGIAFRQIASLPDDELDYDRMEPIVEAYRGFAL